MLSDHCEPLFHRFEIVVIATRDPKTKHLNGRLAIVDQIRSDTTERIRYTVIIPPDDNEERWREGEWRIFQEHELFEWGADSYFYKSDTAWSQSLKLGQEIGAIDSDELPAARGLPNAEQIIQLIEHDTDDWRPLWRWLLQHAYVSELITALRLTKAKDTQAYLCYLLGSRYSRRAAPLISSFLNDPDVHLRGEAANALRQIGSARAGPALLDQLLVETEDSNKSTLALALGSSNYRPAVPDLIQLLQADNATVRGCAAWSLGELTAIEAQSALSDTLKTESDAYAINQIDIALARIREIEVNIQRE